MKVLAKPIEMVAWFNEGGLPTPIRFKLKTNEESSLVIKIDKILFKEKEKLAGNVMYLYRCQSLIEDIEKTYELKYEINTCRWMLYKM